MRIPPTGHNISVRGTSVLTVENGKVTPWAVYLGRGRAPAKHRPVTRTLERRKENTDDDQNSR
jgi:hypothetical protein